MRVFKFISISLIVLFTSVIACFGQLPSTKTIDFNAAAQAGSFSNGTYTNSYLGITFDLPDCFVPADSGTTERAKKKVADQNPDLRNSVNSTAILLSAACSYVDDRDRKIIATISIAVEPVPTGTTPEQYARKLIENTLQRSDTTVIGDIRAEKLGNAFFQSMDLVTNRGGEKLDRKYFLSTYRNAGLAIGIIDGANVMMQKVVESLRSFSIAKN